MPKSEHLREDTEDDIQRLLIAAPQHYNMLKKAGVKNIPEDTLAMYREEVFPFELREFVRCLMVLIDYTKMMTVMPKHVIAAYKTRTGKRLVYNRRANKPRNKSKAKK